LSALDQLRSAPERFGLFAALRVLEQTYSSRPRLGESRQASDDPIRLGHAPHFNFAPTDVAQLTFNEDVPRLEQYSFGLFGPNGPLPAHFTETAYERRRHLEDSTVIDFLNIFQHRMISLFYRAWANSDPAANRDRPSSDRFASFVGATFGIAPETARDRDGVPDRAKLYRAGLFARQIRSAESLETILADYFGAPVRVREFVGTWLTIPQHLRSRLGGGRELASLGKTTVLGRASWQRQFKFEIVLGPLTFKRLVALLPGQGSLRELHALVRFFTTDEYAWQVRMLLPPEEVPRIQLGQAGLLGWTTWLGSVDRVVDDVVIQDQQAGLAPQAS
jgi:type VI secretion system protein ImpH